MGTLDDEFQTITSQIMFVFVYVLDLKGSFVLCLVLILFCVNLPKAVRILKVSSAKLYSHSFDFVANIVMKSQQFYTLFSYAKFSFAEIMRQNSKQITKQ